jgi:hypothetical protein
MESKNYTATIEVAKSQKMFSTTSKEFQNGGAKILKATAQKPMTNLSFSIPVRVIQNRN